MAAGSGRNEGINPSHSPDSAAVRGIRGPGHDTVCGNETDPRAPKDALPPRPSLL